MSKTYLSDTLKTVCQGALGAMTFGAYHQFTTNKIMELNNENIKKDMELNNEKIRLQHERENEKIRLQYERENEKIRLQYEREKEKEIQHKKEMDDLREKFDNLERTTKSRWF